MIVQRLTRIKDWYEHNERRVSTFSLIAGFVFDSLTLTRIDSLLDNAWLGINLVAVAVCIILLHKAEHENLPGEDSRPDTKKHFWLFNVMQFNFGALLGASFIFYFRSAALSVSWPFLLLLLAAMFANELLKKHYDRLVFQISFLYLSIFVFSIFLVPVLLHRIGPVVFLASGVLSLLVLWGFIKILKEFSRQTLFSVASIFIIINILYFANIIPAIPLALKDGGIYHSVTRTLSGGYAVAEEKKGWRDIIRLHDTIHLVPGDTLYAYSAVFSPTDLDTNIVHEWQYKDEDPPAGGSEWVTSSRIPLRLFGGRAEGFRTYSVKSNLREGLWRVNVATPRGAIIGRITFRIVESTTRPPVDVVIKR
ncbi:MAG: hypothetical protein A2832_00975 [Candidatus Zambryskibacteria bacterium RIFCSPHIGHO2_01_FULL_44_22b]|uniref:DUF2914 domain-containing protein n=1 Tax=Candidatus Zambryskibacteria bacterium RIFCSPHIGHO2_01_FULL_44_22b TaxID=1802737 RepID=A0A1G2SXS8_9BACT|nr:MAG: hypothetical protein A2832_00975 [Candidatus Zambryskibacteria bacterium RIFCSPHIGHO2_01_FULL_44_22b]